MSRNDYYSQKLPVNAMNTFEKFILHELNAKSRNHYFVYAEKLYNNGKTPTPYDLFATTTEGLFFMIEAKSTTRDYIKLDDRFKRQVNDMYKRWLKYPKLHRGVFLFAFQQDSDTIQPSDMVFAVFVQYMKFILNYMEKLLESDEHTKSQKLYSLQVAGLTRTRIKKDFFLSTQLPKELTDIEFPVIVIPLSTTPRGKTIANFDVLIEAMPLEPLKSGMEINTEIIMKSRSVKRYNEKPLL